jgi:hypothetical protein
MFTTSVEPYPHGPRSRPPARDQLGVAEDDAVRRRLHPDLADVLRAGIEVREAIDEAM